MKIDGSNYTCTQKIVPDIIELEQDKEHDSDIIITNVNEDTATTIKYRMKN